jgi:hypothetical protein
VSQDEDFVTRADLRADLLRLEERLGKERAAFEMRLEAQVKAWMTEVGGHIVRVSEEANSGRRDLIESNQEIVGGLKRTEARMDRAEEGAGRHRESTAARLKAIEASSDAVVAAIKEFGKQLQDVRRAVEARRNR